MSGRIVYASFVDTIDSDATLDVWNLIGTSATHIRLLGWELTSNAVAATLTTLSMGHADDNGTGGTAAAATTNADDKLAGTLGVLITNVGTVGADGGRLMSYQWEQLGPIGHIFTPEMAPISAVSKGFSLQQTTAATWVASGWVCWEEITVT